MCMGRMWVSSSEVDHSREYPVSSPTFSRIVSSGAPPTSSRRMHSKSNMGGGVAAAMTLKWSLMTELQGGVRLRLPRVFRRHVSLERREFLTS